MQSTRVLSRWAALFLLAYCGSLFAQEKPADAVLKGKGLTRAGVFYLLDGDVNLRTGLRAMRQARSQLDSNLAKRAAIERQIRGIRDGQLQLYVKDKDLSAQMDRVKGIPLRYNDLVAQVNIVRGQIQEAQRYIDDREKALKAVSIPSDRYIDAVKSLCDQMEATQRQYDALATDPEVKAALGRLNADSRFRFRLGPSEEFATELRSVRREREKVRSAAVRFELEGGVPVVPVVLNDTLPWKMVLDSGAAFVTLTYPVAHELGLNTEASNRTVRLQTADGKVIGAPVAILKSIKVGQFVVENVECAVLPKGVAGDNLLGGTFLSHFAYQMDLNAGELHLAQIGATATPDAKPGESTAITKAPATTSPVPVHLGSTPPTNIGDNQVKVGAAGGWVRSSCRVEEGRCYRLIATGLWKDSRGRECGPEGSCPNSCFSLLGPQTELTKEQKADYYVGQHPRGALICRIGDEQWDFYVGAECRFLAPMSGMLSFHMNDDDRNNTAQPGECTVTCVPTEPEWIRPDGTVEIIAQIDITDLLHLTPQGPYWEWDGHWAKVGLNSGYYPTVINGIYWWPSWASRTTTNKLAVPALWPADPARVRIVETIAKRGQVEIASTNANDVAILFQKKPRGPGATQIATVLRLK